MGFQIKPIFNNNNKQNKGNRMARLRKQLKLSETRTQISMSLPVCMLRKLDKMADMESRSRSNFVLNLIKQAAKERLGE